MMSVPLIRVLQAFLIKGSTYLFKPNTFLIKIQVFILGTYPSQPILSNKSEESF